MVRLSFGHGSITLCSFHEAGKHTEAFFLSIGDIARVVRAENFLAGAQQSIAEWFEMFMSPSNMARNEGPMPNSSA
jgi:hypothetical protein